MRKRVVIAGLAALATSACISVEATEAPEAAAAPAPALPTAQQLVTARQAGMHMSATLLFTEAKQAIDAGADLKPHAHVGEGLERWAAAIPGLFPPGSVTADSRAKPEIWTNKADFDAKAAAMGAASTRLAELANANDKPGFAAQWAVVRQTCNACHTPYRVEQRRGG